MMLINLLIAYLNIDFSAPKIITTNQWRHYEIVPWNQGCIKKEKMLKRLAIHLLLNWWYNSSFWWIQVVFHGGGFIFTWILVFISRFSGRNLIFLCFTQLKVKTVSSLNLIMSSNTFSHVLLFVSNTFPQLIVFFPDSVQMTTAFTGSRS